MRGVDPISDAAMAVRPIDRMTSDRADDLAIHADGGVRPLLTLELFQARRDVVANLRGGIRPIHPREPFAQIRSIAIGHGEQRLRVVHFELPQLEAGGHDEMEQVHAVPAGFCGLRDFEMDGVSVVSGCIAYIISDVFRISNADCGSSAYWNRLRSSGEIMPYLTSASKLMISFQYFEP